VTTVPFKPEPGRAVYCKDCIAKIKSGEVKVEKRGQDQIKYDETKFYKPLADLGIEFAQKDRGKVEEGERYHEREDKHLDKHIVKPASTENKPGILGAIKKVFIQKEEKHKDHSALKEVLNKVMSEPKAEIVQPPIAEVPKPLPVLAPEPISLDSLKDKIKEEASKPPRQFASGDRSASVEEMNKLKDLISAKIEKKEEKKVEEIPISTIPSIPNTPAPEPIPQKPAKEVPEDVLRKILE
jgi:hypothetical protein